MKVRIIWGNGQAEEHDLGEEDSTLLEVLNTARVLVEHDLKDREDGVAFVSIGQDPAWEDDEEVVVNTEVSAVEVAGQVSPDALPFPPDANASSEATLGDGQPATDPAE